MMNGNSAMMNGNMINGNMMNGYAMANNQQHQPAMNMNVMQPMNNSISNNFGAAGGMMPAGGTSANNGGPKQQMANSKPDPFAGLGF